MVVAEPVPLTTGVEGLGRGGFIVAVALRGAGLGAPCADIVAATAPEHWHATNKGKRAMAGIQAYEAECECCEAVKKSGTSVFI